MHKVRNIIPDTGNVAGGKSGVSRQTLTRQGLLAIWPVTLLQRARNHK